MEKRTFFRDFLNTIKDVRFSIARFIKYQLIAKIIITILLLPLIQQLFSLIMKKSGFATITNNELLKFILSPGGILAIILVLFTVVFVMLIQLGGLVILCHQTEIRQTESSFFQIVKFLFSRIKNLIGVGSLLFVVTFLFLAPYLNMGFGVEFSTVKIPGFIEEFILQNMYLNLLLKVLTFAGVVLALMCIFCLHIVLLEGTTSTIAIKKSFKMVWENLGSVLKEIFLSLFIIILFMISTLLAFSLLSIVIYLIVPSSIKLIAGIILIAIVLLIAVSLYLIVLPLIIMRVTKLYYRLTDNVPTINIQTRKGGFLKRLVTSIATGVLFIYCIVAYVLLVPSNGAADTKDVVTKVTAHRGSSIEAPENSISSLKLAIEHKTDYSELDAQEAKDGSIFITHDSNFKRTASFDGNIWEMNYDDVKKLDIGSNFSSKFKGEKIPTLAEYIDTAKGKIKLNIEIKENGHEKNLVASVVKIIEEKNFVDSCIVTSLDYNAIQQVKKLNPKIKVGYITFVALGDIKNLNVDLYSVEETNVTHDFVAEAHSLGREVHAWTINEEEDMKKMGDMNVDSIITDNDELAIQTLADNKALSQGIEDFIVKLFPQLADELPKLDNKPITPPTEKAPETPKSKPDSNRDPGSV